MVKSARRRHFVQTQCPSLRRRAQRLLPMTRVSVRPGMLESSLKSRGMVPAGNPHPSRRRRAPNGTICGISVVELKSQIFSNGNDVSKKQEHSGAGIRPDWDTLNPALTFGRLYSSRSPACPGCRRPTVRTPSPLWRPNTQADLTGSAQ